MNNEASVWDVVRPLLQPYGRVERVENALGSGMPDVSYCLRWRGSSNAVEGWIELKYALDTSVSSFFLNQHKMLDTQINWHAKQAHSGGRSYLLTGRGTFIYLHRSEWYDDGSALFDLVNSWNVLCARSTAVLAMDVRDQKFGRELLYCLTR